VDYGEHQRVRSNVQFLGRALTGLIAHEPTIAFLRRLFGEEIVFMTWCLS